MKRIILLALAICIEHSSNAQTNVSGYILANTTWTLANSPYIVTGNILVSNGVTLTIEPGVTVKFDTTKTLQIDGELLAIGTAQNRITFTATDATPARGSWGRIQFSPNSTDAVFDTSGNYVSGSILKYCDIRYGGGVPGDVTVYCDTAAPYFSNCRISDCLKHAIYSVSTAGKVDSSSIRNCGGNAIEFASLRHPVYLVILNDTFENNAGGIIRYATTAAVFGGDTTTFSSITVNNCVFSNSGRAFHVINSGNSVISNNLFDANYGAITGSLGVNAIISDNVFTGQISGVIGFTNNCNVTSLSATNLTISNNYFEGNKGAIFATAAYSLVESNTFLNNELMLVLNGDCQGIGGSIGFIDIYSTQGQFMNNTIDGTTNTYNQGSMIETNGNIEIAYNIIKNNTPGNLNAWGTGNSNICSNKFFGNSGEIIYGGRFIHHNEFINNGGTGHYVGSNTIVSVGDNSIINNNEFQGNTGIGSPILSVGIATVTNNRFINNVASGKPIISTSKNSSVDHNDFLNNSGISCLQLQGNAGQSVITQNNLVNPNVQYEVENQIPFGPGTNIDLSNNYWGTTDTAHIESVIKDYFDNANLSVVLYPPVLAVSAFVDTNASCASAVCALNVSGTVVNTNCYGDNTGSINLSVANGTTPYTYAWSSGASTEDISSRTSGTYTVTVIDANFCSATKSFIISQPASPVAVTSGVVANANCNSDGSITIAAGGGASPYTYNWGSGITTQNRTGLNPGNYSVTVRDNNNCSATQSFTVGQDAGPIISGVVANTNCNIGCDGAIHLSVSGVAPFTYDWGSGFGTSADTTGLCAGTYNVTVADSNNCGIAASFNVASPVAVSASANIATDITCFGFSDGAATAVANGGTPPYSFLWSDGQTAASAISLSAGNYDVTVTDSLGCASLASITLSDGNNVFAGAIGGATSAELNQSLTYIVSANPNYNYVWSVLNGIILSGQGSNTIEVTWSSAGTGLIELIASEQGCADTVSKTVTVVDTAQNCSALFYLYPDTVPHSYFVVNTASGIAPLYYSWNWGDGSANDTAAYPSHTYASAGFYTICLTITDSAGCSDTYCNPYFLLKADDESSAMIQVNVVSPTFTGIQNNEAIEDILVYPNPTSNSITLKGHGINKAISLGLFDAMGKLLLQQSIESDELNQGTTIDLNIFSNGLYFLRVQNDEGSRYIKVIKQ